MKVLRFSYPFRLILIPKCDHFPCCVTCYVHGLSSPDLKKSKPFPYEFCNTFENRQSESHNSRGPWSEHHDKDF